MLVIKRYLGIQEQTLEKGRNIWIAISLGNKDFTPQTVREYMLWAAEHTQSKVLILIPDSLHAINLELLDHKSREAALRKAHQMGDEWIGVVKEILNEFPKSAADRFATARIE